MLPILVVALSFNQVVIPWSYPVEATRNTADFVKKDIEAKHFSHQIIIYSNVIAGRESRLSALLRTRVP